ncbi:hypothetical protein BCR34DRAFT_667757 [Clohesyomyces aquaticus]|uniref:Oxidoreductase acuF-like C2H2 type zinc-finger domain-containing protein n=1 Tax=Clohesyomyces aquaticus TaxID=1231657 RepID=A0A1Y1YWG5_9PLEO|nr:hypothetical protein BCR34DRAFT_667757 [Clohesyomyces aquaticus]
MAALISDSHSKCYIAFESLVEALDRPSRDFSTQLPPKSIREEFDKYRIWAGNVGAPHSGRRYDISLDYRLREASFLKKQILDLLNSLEEKLKRTASLIRNEVRPFEELEDGSDTQETESLTSDDTKDDCDASEESPWEISSESEQSDASSQNETPTPSGRLAEIPGRKPNPSTLTSSISILQLGRTPRTEMPRLLDSIKFIIAHLYRIPIRKPAPLDRIKDRESLESSIYQHFDVLYVMDKFKDIGPQLASRLGKAITRRRQILHYRESHKRNLDTARVEPREIAATTPRQKPMGLVEKFQSTLDSPAIMSRASSSDFTFRSKATTLRPGDAQITTPEPDTDFDAPYTPSTVQSRSSRASSYTGKELTVTVPTRPMGKDGNELEWFECPYCLITKNITSDRKWRRHVFEDLKPYVCTYEDCDLQDYFFEDRDTWFKHETLQHRAKWFCNVEKHPEFSDAKDFLRHMDIGHNTGLDREKFAHLRDMFLRPSGDVDGVCNLCKRHAKRLKSHVSRHLQQIALFALPRINETVGSGMAERFTDASEANTSNLITETDSSADTSSFQSQPSHLAVDTELENEVAGDTHTFDDLEVPESIEMDWDEVTDKFMKARQPGTPLRNVYLITEDDRESFSGAIEDLPGVLRTSGYNVTVVGTSMRFKDFHYLNDETKFDLIVFCLFEPSTDLLFSDFVLPINSGTPTLAIVCRLGSCSKLEIAKFDRVLNMNRVWGPEELQKVKNEVESMCPLKTSHADESDFLPGLITKERSGSLRQENEDYNPRLSELLLPEPALPLEASSTAHVWRKLN